MIAVCGIDGSGKTTQINMLKDYLQNEYDQDVYVTKQPTDFYRQYDRFRQYIAGENSDQTANILYELALLSAADKIRHYETEIRPNLNKIIITDRYVFSAYAYFLARGIQDINWLKEINKHLPLPDITVYIDVQPQTAYERILKRDGKFTKKEETDIKVLSLGRGCFIRQPWGGIPNYHIIKAESRHAVDIHQEIKMMINHYIGRA